MQEFQKLVEKEMHSGQLVRGLCWHNENTQNLLSGSGDVWWWVPEDGALPLEEVKQCLDGKTILIVGDSLSRQANHAMEAWKVAAGVDLNIIFHRSNVLFNDTDIRAGWKNLNELLLSDPLWVKPIEEGLVDLAVINTGLWWGYTPELHAQYASGYRDTITAASDFLMKAMSKQSRLAHQNVMWRTTTIRHYMTGEWDQPHCRCDRKSEHKGPGPCGCCQTKEPRLQASAEDYYNGRVTVEINDALKDVLREYPFSLLDAYSLALPRQDDHDGVDCTHFCTPGTVLAFNSELFRQYCTRPATIGHPDVVPITVE